MTHYPKTQKHIDDLEEIAHKLDQVCALIAHKAEEEETGMVSSLWLLDFYSDINQARQKANKSIKDSHAMLLLETNE